MQPRTIVDYKPASATGVGSQQFVITDGRDKVYLVALSGEARPNFTTVTEANVGAFGITSPTFVLGDTVLAVNEESDIVRFSLPSLEAAGETDLPGDVAWGPYQAGDLLVVATSDEKLIGVSAQGDMLWNVPLAGGDLAGAPLVVEDDLVLAYRKGVCERRSLKDGSSLGMLDVEHPLAAGPVRFLNRILLTASDGTLLVIEAP